MPCLSTSQLIADYGPNWQDFVTVNSGPHSTSNCGGCSCVNLSDYQMGVGSAVLSYYQAGNSSRGWSYQNNSACCYSPNNNHQARMCGGYGYSGYNVTINIEALAQCPNSNGQISCNWYANVNNADAQLCSTNGTLTLNFTGSTPTISNISVISSNEQTYMLNDGSISSCLSGGNLTGEGAGLCGQTPSFTITNV